MSHSNYLRQPLYEQGQQPYSDQYGAPPPSAPSAAPPQPSGKFSSQGWRDPVWAALFLLHLLAYLGGGSYMLSKYADELTAPTNSTANATSLSSTPHYIVNPHLYSSTYHPTVFPSTSYGDASSNVNTTTSTDDHIRLQRDVIYLGLSSLAISAVVALLWLSLTKSFARTMIYTALVADILVSLVMLVVCLMYGALIGVILFGVFALLKAVWVYWMRSRIELAAVILTHAVHCIQKWPATVAAAFLSIVVQGSWTVGWGFCTVGFYYAVTRVTDAQNPQQVQQQDSSVSYVVVFLTLVSFYWVSQVIKNTLHVTVSGVAATWYYLYPHGDYHSPTASSMKRALTTSFGSICLGSLVLSVVRALRVTVNMMANQPGNVRNGGAAAVRAVCYCLAQCLLSILDRVVEYVNAYAFAYVALYGKSYCEAASAVWEVTRQHTHSTCIPLPLHYTLCMPHPQQLWRHTSILPPSLSLGSLCSHSPLCVRCALASSPPPPSLLRLCCCSAVQGARLRRADQRLIDWCGVGLCVCDGRLD